MSPKAAKLQRLLIKRNVTQNFSMKKDVAWLFKLERCHQSEAKIWSPLEMPRFIESTSIKNLTFNFLNYQGGNASFGLTLFKIFLVVEEIKFSWHCSWYCYNHISSSQTFTSKSYSYSRWTTTVKQKIFLVQQTPDIKLAFYQWYYN